MTDTTRPIDLRSDTVTQPTEAMQAAMAAATLGDDVLEGDPTVRALEEKVAALLGKDAAVFVPSGTMANLLALRSQTQPGGEFICDHESHLVFYEAASYAAVAGLGVRCTHTPTGLFSVEDFERLVREDHPHFPPTQLLALENTHNRGGGIPWPLEQVQSVALRARELGLRVHMDGARLWNACTATNLTPADYARSVDTVSVCFSKGLGCPAGSALVGDEETIHRARRLRQMLGGSMRQAGVLGAAAIHALDHHRERLAEDHARAQRFLERLASIAGVQVDCERVRTNMVFFDLTPNHGTAEDFCRRIANKVRMLAEGPQMVRAVMHMQVGDEDVDRAVQAIGEELAAAGAESRT